MKKVLLAILDGYGLRSDSDRNAVAAANAPVLKGLFEKYPHTRLACCGRDVGLPDGQMGNSEVGHLNIGAGRVVYQEITRIDAAIESGELDRSEPFQNLLKSAARKGVALHLMGLISDGGVHSSNRHVGALLERFANAGLRNVFIHAFTDGRDTPPRSGLQFVEQVDQHARALGLPGVVSVIGRYYAMDRDKRWDRVQLAYDCLVKDVGNVYRSVNEAISDSYQNDVTDEFIKPALIQPNGVSQGRIKPHDTILFLNFRADRARELSHALAIPGFDRFAVKELALEYFTLTQYDAAFPFPVLFKPQTMEKLLGGVIAEAGLKQLRCAETEKYAHVTYFFNGGVETPFTLEDRIMIPSPHVATYDLQPEMSSVEVANTVVTDVTKEKHDLIIVNFANCDMVGHTGSLEAATKAVEAVDVGIGRILTACRQHGYTAFVTADHGNAEQMWDYESNCPHTQHTLNDVPFIAVDDNTTIQFRERGRLADIAPTILAWMEQPQPTEMTGKSLILP
ncbi:MAG: 2,3-bisphosphoglycerate-independent phosphoglycerate mutase [bacterium]|nr:2,3-bisphosphoglycerate-independent phosphoglycerate mutase [bacterium]